MISTPLHHRIPTVLGELTVREAGTGPTAVLWHSMFVDSTSWDRVIGELSAHRRLLLIDGPGHGRSDPLSRRSSIDECAVAALSVLDALAPGSAVDWVGNAWGGHVGMSIASRYGEHIRSLVALSSPTQPTNDRSTIAALALILRFVGPVPFLVSKIAEAQLTDVSRAHPSTLRILTDALARTERRSLARAVRSFIVDRADATDSLASIVAPALFLASDDRGEWSPDAATQAAASARNARSAVVTGARTLLAVEQPAAVAELITAFWAEHSAR